MNYRLAGFAGARFAAYCRPATITFLLTSRCNARCVHCDIWKNSGPEDSPTIDRLKSCVSDLRRWLGPIKVTFSGGEALMKPYTIELLDYATKLGLCSELLTNGFWSDQEKIKSVALVNPWRITISYDGFGETHDKIRGHQGFFDKTSATVRTLCEMRREKNLTYKILLKTVVMEHNLDDLTAIAKFTKANGIEVRYQPIEQNYNTEEDPGWYLNSQNWPRDTAKASAAISELVALKKDGFPIENGVYELETMIRYFNRPADLQLAVQSHAAPDQPICSAATSFQVEANGDVRVCARRPPVGNIKTQPIRDIWRNRPPYWKDCCIPGSSSRG